MAGKPVSCETRVMNKIRGFLLVVALFSAGGACAEDAAQTPEQKVLAVDNEYIAAELSRDVGALRRLVDDRFLYNSSSGKTTDKEELIKTVLKMSMVGQNISERTVLIDGDIALVFGTTELHFAEAGKPESKTRLRYTSTYVNRNGQWRMLALQMQQRAPN
jgi:hypothetical protein